MTCPSCGAEASDTDAFCEACGHDLGRVPMAVTDPVARPACELCGADVEDGFCVVCGAKARTERDHWTESPSDWVGGVCDRGVEHARNEDAMALSSSSDGTFAVLVVCDGVTTAPDSDRASLAAAREAGRVLSDAPRPSGSTAGRVHAWQGVLERACREANAETLAIARTLGDPPEPPSCTFVAAVRDHDLVVVAWCGDSRAYWLADHRGSSSQLTTDHSLGTEMIRAGRSREEAEADPACHTITRWLGADSVDATPEVRSVSLDGPGWLVVMSDGMWNEASTIEQLHDLLDRAAADGASTPTSLAESLAGYANECGGHDNITVALARCEAAPGGAALP
ncbi:MAG: protein phosphatase 2C domain-containing protein [Ilumatobacteraceae bacterium]